MLNLNVENSKCMISFKHPKKLSNFNIIVNNSIIEQVDYFNYLGIPLDQKITWTPHHDKVSIKNIPCYRSATKAAAYLFQNIF